MTVYRFVNQNGWEKWIDVPDPPPNVWMVADAPVSSLSFTDVACEPKHVELRGRLFAREIWRVFGWPDEVVYSEEGRAIEGSDRFASDRPSIHRERQYADALSRIQEIIRNAPDMRSPLGAAISAMGIVEEVAHELRRCDLPSNSKGQDDG